MTGSTGGAGAPNSPSAARRVEILRGSPLLADLPEELLAWLADRATPVSLSAGEILLRQGEPADAMYVVVAGNVDVFAEVGDEPVPVAVAGPGAALGELALIAERTRSATVQARDDVRLLRIEREVFDRLLDHPPFARRLLAAASDRLEQRQLLTYQHSKMVALGQLTAGLLHELNNPSAALRRHAATLPDRLAQWRQASARLSPAAAAAADRIAQAGDPRAAPSDPLDRSDAEQRMQQWMTRRGVPEPWILAPILVAQGLHAEKLDAETAALDDPAALTAVLQVVSAMLDVDALVAGVLGAAQRISETVAAVLAYSHHGEAPVQDVVVTDGIEQALTLLAHKIGDGVRIVRDYEQDLPAIEGYPGDLNSVWTNLLDNALDAVGEEGVITLTARRGDGVVAVEIIDDGPGVPDDIKSRIFDPFFTTKPIGEGTGVGLGLVRTIVVQRHRGDVSLSSEPGRTVFRVRLPLRHGRAD